MDAAGGGAADQQRHLHALAFQLAGEMALSSSEGVIRPERADDVSAFRLRRFDDLGGGHHDAEIDHLEIVTLQHDAGQCLAGCRAVALTVASTILPAELPAIAGNAVGEIGAPSPLP